jgi:hypothetical protein
MGKAIKIDDKHDFVIDREIASFQSFPPFPEWTINDFYSSGCLGQEDCLRAGRPPGYDGLQLRQVGVDFKTIKTSCFGVHRLKTLGQKLCFGE